MKKIIKAVPDTSVIIEGLLSKLLSSGNIVVKTIIIHEAVLAELESQANKGRNTGHEGLAEIVKLRKLSQKKKFTIEYKGSRPGDFEIKFAKSGEIDSLIRDLAFKEKATLVTADIVQSKVAEAKGISVVLFPVVKKVGRKFLFEKYVGKETSVLRLVQGKKPVAIQGSPGRWKSKTLGTKPLSREDAKLLCLDVIENAKDDYSCKFSERKGVFIARKDAYSIVIAKPPVSDIYELNVFVRMKTNSYKKAASSTNAKALLVSGRPGMGKSSLAEALIERYVSQGLSVKVFEGSRMLSLPEGVSSFSLNKSESAESVLLTRPDVVVFDELFSNEDFELADYFIRAGYRVVAVAGSDSIDSAKALKKDLGCDVLIWVENGDARYMNG